MYKGGGKRGGNSKVGEKIAGGTGGKYGKVESQIGPWKNAFSVPPIFLFVVFAFSALAAKAVILLTCIMQPSPPKRKTNLVEKPKGRKRERANFFSQRPVGSACLPVSPPTLPR